MNIELGFNNLSGFTLSIGYFRWRPINPSDKSDDDVIKCFLNYYSLGETNFDSPKYKGSRFSLTSNPEDKEEVSISWRSIPVKILSTGHLKFYFMLPALRLQKSHSEKTLIYGVIWGFSRLWTWIFEFWCERGQMT